MDSADIKTTTKEVTEVVETPIAMDAPRDGVIDITIQGATKQEFRINGDNNKILKLNPSDLNIMDRLEKGVNALTDLMSEISHIDTETADVMEELHRADQKMREQLDWIFDSNVSEVCCGTAGTMYDIINGVFRWEHIIDSLTNLYKNNLNSEYHKMKSRIDKHISKYTDHQSSASRATKPKRKK